MNEDATGVVAAFSQAVVKGSAELAVRVVEHEVYAGLVVVFMPAEFLCRLNYPVPIGMSPPCTRTMASSFYISTCGFQPLRHVVN